MGRMGQTGETYAFNKDGVMVSNSRFDDQLVRIGLLPDTEDAQSHSQHLAPRSGRRHDARLSARKFAAPSSR